MSSSRPAADNPVTAVAWLTRYARTHVRSTFEARQYLRRRGVRPAAIERAMAACQGRGLLDDSACARLWASHWARQGYAWAAIRLKLLEKGLSEASIAAATEAVDATAAGDAERAHQVLAQHVSRRSGIAPPRPRLARILASRGFDSETIDHLLREHTDDQ